MIARKVLGTTLPLAAGLALACLELPALRGDDTPKGHANEGGRHAAPQKQSSGQGNGGQAGGGRTYGNGGGQSGRARTDAPPANRTPSNDGGNRGNNAGGGGGDRTSQRNPGGGRIQNPPSQPAGAAQAPAQPTYNPAGRVRNGGGNAGERNPNTPTYNPGNRNPNYNPAGRNANPPARNPGERNSNPGYNPGNRNSGGYNSGGNRSNPGGYNQGGGRTWHPPQGATPSTPRQGGGTTFTRGNAQYHTDSGGRLVQYSRPGTEARFGNNGRVSYAHFTRPDRSTVIVNRGPRGERTVVTVRPDRTRVVSYGPRYGYVERPLAARPGYISRTYVYGGRPYVRVYHSYGWRGVTYYRYVPPVYYHPVFYGWAFNPWITPISFRWGWYRDPWYGYWGGYFAPAPVYPTAALWLTDYLLAENLRLAYESRQAAQQGQYEPAPDYPQTGATLTPEIKAAIAEEVRQQIEAERAAASSAQAGGNAGYSGANGFSGKYFTDRRRCAAAIARSQAKDLCSVH